MKASYSVNKPGGLLVSFRDTSREVPVGSQYHWDFGDLIVVDGEINPEHTYDYPGFYLVILTITPPSGTPLSYKSVVGLSPYATTTLTDTIYNLIDGIIPKQFISLEDYETNKRLYIEKWQLYLQPIVNHDIPIEQYNNEFYYEALENQLVMEMATYDWVTSSILTLLGSLSTTSSTTSPSGEDGDGEIKKIVTGPSEVEFFSNSEVAYKTLTEALKKNGIVDIIKQNLCMLAERLSIYLPICSMVRSNPVVPSVGNKRNPGRLGGPNPSYPVKG